MARCACEKLFFSRATGFFSRPLAHCTCAKLRFSCAMEFFSAALAHCACEKPRFPFAMEFFSCTQGFLAQEKLKCAGETGHCTREELRFSCAARRFPGPRTGCSRAKKGVAEATPHLNRGDSFYSGEVVGGSGGIGGVGSSDLAVLRPRNGWMLNSVSFSDPLPYRCFTPARSKAASSRPLSKSSCCLLVISCLAAAREACRARTSSSSSTIASSSNRSASRCGTSSVLASSAGISRRKSSRVSAFVGFGRAVFSSFDFFGRAMFISFGSSNGLPGNSGAFMTPEARLLLLGASRFSPWMYDLEVWRVYAGSYAAVNPHLERTFRSSRPWYTERWVGAFRPSRADVKAVCKAPGPQPVERRFSLALTCIRNRHRMNE